MNAATIPTGPACRGSAGWPVPRISICILNHNYGHYLPDAIDSCLRQQPGAYDLAEIVVIDDGSSDESLAICRDYGTAVRVLERGHEGFAATLTAAIDQARGNWVALLDADDWFADDKLSRLVGHLHGETLIVRHYEYVVDADGRPLIPGPHPGGNTSTLIVRRDAATDLLPVPNELYLHVFDELGRGVRSDTPLTYYRVHDGSMTDRKTPGVFCGYMTDVCDMLARHLTSMAASPPHWAGTRRLRRLARHYRATAAAYELEALLQCGHAQSRWGPLIRQLAWTAASHRGWAQAWTSLRSAVACRPIRTLAAPPEEDRAQ